jgi:hypothetical protein
MGFRYRKSMNFGPFRANLSKSGMGYSLGGRGFRVGIDPRGRSYTSIGLPGSGMSYRTSGSGARRGRYASAGRTSQGCLSVVVCILSPALLGAAGWALVHWSAAS